MNKKSIILTIMILLLVGCVGESFNSNSSDDTPCLHTFNSGLSIGGYTGCWGDCQHGTINCLVVAIYADEDCTEMIEAVSFPDPFVTPWEILISATKEWPDEAWLLFYVSDCNRNEWYIPYYWDYFECPGPHWIPFYVYDCDQTITWYYSDIGDVFDDSCTWGNR